MHSRKYVSLYSAILAAVVCSSGAQEAAPPQSPDARPSPYNSSLDPQLARYQSVESGKSLARNLSLAQKLRGRLDEIANGLGEKLSAGDRAALINYATLEADHLDYVRGRLKQAEQEVCRKRQGLDAVALEAAFTQGIHTVAAESNAYYRVILDALSSDGRDQVLKYVDDRVSAGTVSQARFDTAAFARERPELARQAVEAACAASSAPVRPAPSVPAVNAAFGTVTR